MKINTNISKDFKDIEVTISANELTKEVQSIINALECFNTYVNKIIATKNNEIFIINIEDIICIYSEGKYNYCRTNKGIYKVKQTLYELEDKLSPNGFIRISNSCISNFRHIYSFNNEIVGTIKVKYKDGTVDYVSRRRISSVLKALKGGI